MEERVGVEPCRKIIEEEERKMKILRGLSQTVAFILALVAAAALVPDSATAGPKFDPHMAKGGLPECMQKLNSAVSELEASQLNLLQAQTELTTCTANTVVSSDTVDVPRTGQTNIYDGGDDGDLQMGSPLPDPRFTDNVDGTVTDNLTGLIWTKNANLSVKITWPAALDVCYNLEADGIDLNDASLPGDWRLPNIRELQSILDYGEFHPALAVGHPFVNLQSSFSSYYWTSTTCAGYEPYAWGLSVINGYVSSFDKGGNHGYVWCLRGGE